MTQKQLFAIVCGVILTLISLLIYNPAWAAVLALGGLGLFAIGMLIAAIWQLCGLYGSDTR